ncbi:MAG: hypothetical protein M3O34_04400 [Chloroflexota bacterium]|nr:hypothetical protein [Chloroflexota bacterium]
MKMKQLALAGGAFVAGVALTLVTVAQVAPTVSASPSNQHNDAMMAAQKAQVIATTFQLDKSGFHDIDVATNAGQPAPAGALGNVRRAHVALKATDWPDPLRATATELDGHMQRLEEALRNEGWSAAAEPAEKVHDVGHDLSAMAYQWLSGAEVQPPQGH